MRIQALLLAFLILTLSLAAQALELVAPATSCTLREGKVQVIGKAPKADKGKVEFSGQSTSFRVKDGVFTVALNLGPGQHEVRFTVGEDTLVAQWNVDAAATEGVFVYHSDVDAANCKSCHDEGARLPVASDNVSAICYRCHNSFDKLPFVHGPVAMGLCVACHQPHGSANPRLLRIPRQELCTDCHNQPTTASHREFTGEQCQNCHRPHGSDKHFFLK